MFAEKLWNNQFVDYKCLSNRLFANIFMIRTWGEWKNKRDFESQEMANRHKPVNLLMQELDKN